MTDLGLADTVDTAEALLQPVRVPGQVVVDHQMRALEVDALAGGVGGQQHLNLGVVTERLLGLEPICPAHAAVDHHQRFPAAQQAGDAFLKIAEGVAMLGEDNQLLPRGRPGLGDSAGAVGNLRLAGLPGQASGSKDLTEQTGQLPPFGVGAAVAHGQGEVLQRFQGVDFGLELGAGAGGRGLIEDRRLGGLDIAIRRVFEVRHLVRVQGQSGVGRGPGAALEHLQFAQPALQTFAPPQGLVDRLRRRGQAALQNRQGEADRAGALLALQRLGAIELLAHVIANGLVEPRLRRRQPVRNRMGDALGKQRPAVELQEIFLEHAPHQIGGIGAMHAVAKPPCKAVAVEQGHKKLEVFLLAVVGSRRHQQEVAGQRREQPAQPIAPGVLDLAAKEARRQLVRLVADHQIPAAIGRLELALRLVVAGDQFLDEQPGHDRLAGAGVVGEQKAQGLARQHGFVDGGDLVRQRLEQRGVHREQRVEEVRKADTPGLGHQAEERAVAVEAPRPAGPGDLQAGFVVAVEQFVGDCSARRFVGQLQRLGAEPLHVHHGDQRVREDAAQRGIGLEFFKFHWRFAPCR